VRTLSGPVMMPISAARKAVATSSPGRLGIGRHNPTTRSRPRRFSHKSSSLSASVRTFSRSRCWRRLRRARWHRPLCRVDGAPPVRATAPVRAFPVAGPWRRRPAGQLGELRQGIGNRHIIDGAGGLEHQLRLCVLEEARHVRRSRRRIARRPARRTDGDGSSAAWLIAFSPMPVRAITPAWRKYGSASALSFEQLEHGGDSFRVADLAHSNRAKKRTAARDGLDASTRTRMPWRFCRHREP